MEEHAKAELHLSEEHLQEITGGCGQCLKDVEQFNHHSTLANTYHRLSMTAIERNKFDSAVLYQGLSQGHTQAAKDLLNTLKTRHTTPGHSQGPDGSSGN